MHPIWRKLYLNLGGSPLEPWRIPPPSTFIGKIRKAHWNAWLLLALALINSQHLCPKVHGHLAVPELLISCSENHNINSACIQTVARLLHLPSFLGSNLDPQPSSWKMYQCPRCPVTSSDHDSLSPSQVDICTVFYMFFLAAVSRQFWGVLFLKFLCLVWAVSVWMLIRSHIDTSLVRYHSFWWIHYDSQ